MANRIKGITIELNGDATGLNKALQSVNKELKTANSGLKDVSKLLKLDPGNVELLRQKQGYLNDAIKDTEAKLKTEREALDQLKHSEGFDANSEQAKALERQIIADEQELKNLTKEAKEFGSVSTQQFRAAGEKLKEVGNKIGDVGKTLTTKATVPIVTGFTAALKITADFDAQMSKVQAISGATADEFVVLRDKADEMGERTKFSASQAGEAFEYMAMAGWKTEDMLNGIEGIMNLAAASGEDLATTSDIVTDALTAFGLTADDSGHFADVLAAASSNANTNVALMGETFKYVAPVAGAMTYNVEDMAIAIGLMANSGIKGSQAGTALRGILTRLAKPTDEVQAAMDRLDITLSDGDGNMRSFRDIMDQLRNSFDGLILPEENFMASLQMLDEQFANGTLTEKQYHAAQEDLIKETYGAEAALKAQYAAQLAGQNSLSGLLAIVNAAPEDYEKLTAAIDNANGTSEEMAAIMQDNLSGQLEILKSKTEKLAISVGTTLMPFAEKAVGVAQQLIDKFNALSPEQQEIIVKVLGITAVVGPLITILGTLITSVGTIMTVLSGPLVLAIGGAVAAGVLLYKNWDVIKEKGAALLSSVKSTFENIKNTIENVVNRIKGVFNFRWSLPHLALPHFSLSGSFSLNPPSVPNLSVSWYRKAYEDGVMFNRPTVLQTSSGMKGFGDGVGSEVVLGLSRLRELVSSGSGMTINVYGAPGQSEEALAEIIMDRITTLQQREAIGAL